MHGSPGLANIFQLLSWWRTSPPPAHVELPSDGEVGAASVLWGIQSSTGVSSQETARSGRVPPSAKSSRYRRRSGLEDRGWGREVALDDVRAGREGRPDPAFGFVVCQGLGLVAGVPRGAGVGPVSGLVAQACRAELVQDLLGDWGWWQELNGEVEDGGQAPGVEQNRQMKPEIVRAASLRIVEDQGGCGGTIADRSNEFFPEQLKAFKLQKIA